MHAWERLGFLLVAHLLLGELPCRCRVHMEGNRPEITPAIDALLVGGTARAS